MLHGNRSVNTIGEKRGSDGVLTPQGSDGRSGVPAPAQPASSGQTAPACSGTLRETLCTKHGELWVVAHTRSRQEKALCRDLSALAIVHYVPTYQEVRTHGNRRRRVDALLFPGYVFVRGPEHVRPGLLATDRVANVIHVHDQIGLIRELVQIHQAIEAGARFGSAGLLREGTPVRVCRGPLRGIEGLVDRGGPPNRLVLVVQTLGRATSIEINPGDVEPI